VSSSLLDKAFIAFAKTNPVIVAATPWTKPPRGPKKVWNKLSDNKLNMNRKGTPSF
jgi:hypothetical protein